MGPFRAGIPDLVAIRNRAGVSLEEIARSTRISVFYLQAIENGAIEKLPGGIYTSSYIRQYARGIDYSEEDLIGAFGVTGVEGVRAAQHGPIYRLNRLLRFCGSLFHVHVAAATGEKQT